MFVYLINILSICLYALFFCRGEQTKMKKAFFLILCAFQCLIIAAFRVNIGTDYSWYTLGFKTMAESGFSDMTFEDWEIGFVILNKIVGLFTKKPQILIGICAAISLSGTFYLIWKYSNNPFMSVFLFLNTYLFYLDLNYVRQSIAMSIMCFAYGFLQERKFWRFLLLCILAATFHLPVIYLIPVYFVTFLKVNLKTLLLYESAVIVYFMVSDMLLKLLLAHFHTEYADSRFINNGITIYYAVYPLMLTVGMIAVAAYLKFQMSRNLNVLMHLMLLMGAWQIVMTKHALFERFSYYTMPFLLIAVPEAINAFKDKFTEKGKVKLAEQFGEDSEGLQAAERKLEKKVVWIVFAISATVLILAFGYNLMGLIVPKKGVHGVLPYRAAGFKVPNIDSWFKR